MAERSTVPSGRERREAFAEVVALNLSNTIANLVAFMVLNAGPDRQASFDVAATFLRRSATSVAEEGHAALEEAVIAGSLDHIENALSQAAERLDVTLSPSAK